MTTLFSLDTTFTDADHHTHRAYSFAVPSGLREIRVKLAYSPKDFDDEEKSVGIIRDILARDAWYETFTEEEVRGFLPLRNHISVSIDSPDGWLGTAHRHAPRQEYFINEKDCACGFRPAPIKAGEWKITLSFNCVVTGTVDVRVVAEGYDEIR